MALLVVFMFAPAVLQGVLAGVGRLGNCGGTNARLLLLSKQATAQEFSMARILTNREDIRQWAEARGGNPMLMDTPDGTGIRTLLQLTFGQHAINTDGNEGPDRIGGFHLVSWEEWFAALDEGNLALRVSDDPAGGSEAEFEFVERE
jgi:hypothetical protein